jgi:hypothetical protein
MPINPVLLPLPVSADLDLTHIPTIINSLGLKKVEKVAGSCNRTVGASWDHSCSLFVMRSEQIKGIKLERMCISECPKGTSMDQF